MQLLSTQKLWIKFISHFSYDTLRVKLGLKRSNNFHLWQCLRNATFPKLLQCYNRKNSRIAKNINCKNLVFNSSNFKKFYSNAISGNWKGLICLQTCKNRVKVGEVTTNAKTTCAYFIGPSSSWKGWRRCHWKIGRRCVGNSQLYGL